MTEREAKYLGAFLHDIGKFSWRAQERKPGEDHESLGTAFIKSYFMDSAVVNGNNTILNLLDSAAKRALINIHSADIKDASTDREKSASTESRRPLMSVLSRVDIGKSSPPAGIYYYNPAPLEFTAQQPNNINVSEDNWTVNERDMISRHNDSYQKFQSELNKIKGIGDFRTFFTSFYSICEKYLTYISSASYKTVPDISLFDHSKMVAAFSLCKEEGDKGRECLMIKGDISGIQKFIYSELEMTENVAKILRGRSFFVRLLSDAVANYILRELDIWEANLFFNNGGHFVMIAPNTNHNREKLTAIERRINHWLFDDFGSELQLVIGSIEEESSQLLEKFPQKMRELENVLQEKKRKKCFSILDQIMQSPINSKKYLDKSERNNKVFEKIGTKLPKSDYLIEIVTGINSSEKLWGISDINFLTISQNYYLASERELRDKLAELDSYNPLSMIIYNISKTEITKSVIGSSKNPIGYSFKFTGSYIPMNEKDDRPMTFEELAEIDSKDYPLIGVARMDVDSLGAIFAYGLKFVKRSQDDKPIYTPTRISFLSREMNHFFSGTIEKIARDNEIYLVYSGGDDLFAVGSWVKIIEFVQVVREEFGKFACHNLNITLSCGVVIEKSNFPVVYSARASGDELDYAKSQTKEERERKGEKDNKKDRISIFGRKVSWNQLEELLGIADNLLKIVDPEKAYKNEQIPRSFIHTLLETTQQCFDEHGKFQIDKVWQATSKIHYHFARRGVDAKAIEEKKDNYKREFGEYFLKKEAKELVDWYEQFAIPASYVLLKTRNSKK